MKTLGLSLLAGASTVLAQNASDDPFAGIAAPQGIAALLPGLIVKVGEEAFAGPDPLGPVRPLISGIMGGAGKLAGGKLDLSPALCDAFSSPFVGGLIGPLFGSPNGDGPDEKCMYDTSGGTGPYKAGFRAFDSLANHTVYAPLTPPKEKMPVLIWSNGFCLQVGTMFQNFHNEIASHGFVVISDGSPKGDLTSIDRPEDMVAAIDWVTKHPDAKQLGDIDTSKIAVGGQSCGGVEAMRVTEDPRVTLTAIFNSGGIGNNKARMSKITHPIAYFLGGPKDVGYPLGNTDYFYATTTPILVADNGLGHLGTYYQKAGGKTGKAAVAFFKWQFKGDEASKKLFCDATPDSPLIKAGWTIRTKNGIC